MFDQRFIIIRRASREPIARASRLYTLLGLEGVAMHIDYNHPINLSSLRLLCPACGDRMRLIMIAPFTSERGADETTFHCEECGIELKRITRPTH